MSGANSTQGQPHYTVSVAASLTGMHAQTLRQYDRLGLVSPKRTKGRGRRYSPQDVQKLRKVQRLSQERGINLAGVRLALELEDELTDLKAEVTRLKGLLAKATGPTRGVYTADSRGRVQLKPHHAQKRAEVPQDRRHTELTVRIPYHWWYAHHSGLLNARDVSEIDE